MKSDLDSQKRALAYSFLAHIHNNAVYTDGPLDVFIPVVKHALSELYPDGSVKGANISELAFEIENNFNLDFPTPVLRLILGKIAKEVNAQSGLEDIVIFTDGAFIINKFSFESYKESIQRSKQEVANVVNMFNKFCLIYDIAGDTNEGDLLRFIEQNKADISFYLTHETKVIDKQSLIAAQFVDYFKQVPIVYETLRNLYLGSMLTSYLNFQPSKVKLDIELLLDTNFIVSLLDLNTEESTKICNTLMTMCSKLGYKFTVLKDTIEEFQGLLYYKAQSMATASIARTINKEDIYNACDRRGLSKVDLERIADNIEESLSKDYGVYVVPHTEKWSKKAKYSNEYAYLKNFRNTERAALHDATAILYVQDKRDNKKITKFEDVNCWFVNNAISHSGDFDGDTPFPLSYDRTVQPEIIKADDLLSIIWLASPSLVLDKDVIDLGLASMISYTYNSTLPKARIIKELDENIQKYRSSNDITDKDVVRLATRIARRQIEDVQTLNEIAKRDEVEFARRVKEESDRQREIEADSAQKLQKLMDSVAGLIDNLKQNKENQDEIYRARLVSIDETEKELKGRIREVEKKDLELNQEKEELEVQRREHDTKLRILWTRENERRGKLRNDYIQTEFEKEREASKKRFVISICFLVGFVIALILSIFIIPDNLVFPKVGEVKVKLVAIIGSSLTSIIFAIWSIFVARDYYNWLKNPSFEKNKKELLSQQLPKDHEYLSYEDFVSSI